MIAMINLKKQARVCVCVCVCENIILILTFHFNVHLNNQDYNIFQWNAYIWSI